MNILVTGNLGYVGPCVIKQLRSSYPDASLVGYDMGYFSKKYLGCEGQGLLEKARSKESKVDWQITGDVRDIPEALLKGMDTIVHLADVSIDPMGNRFNDVTMEINYKASVKLAEKAKQQGVRHFIFASSCSVYGVTRKKWNTEEDPVNPLTLHARSKAMTELILRRMADESFNVTCLRFAAACGWSEGLRLDLVLNDFVASAVTTGEIKLGSDGNSWRPFIHVSDMARAIAWAVQRQTCGSEYLVVNCGSNEWNVRIIDLAKAVSDVLPGTNVKILPDAKPDRRSYRVNFDRFLSLVKGYEPEYNLKRTVEELAGAFAMIGLTEEHLLKSPFIRLKRINELIERTRLSHRLTWL